MSEQTDRLISLLLPFGLVLEEAEIYLMLLKKGTMTALKLSRELQMGRTKVYRILDKLIEKELVINQFDEVGFKFVAADPRKLSQLVERRIGEVTALRQGLPELERVLLREQKQGAEESKVLYYRGRSGLLQVNYNLLRAKGEFCSFEADQAEIYLPHKEAEMLRRELVEAKIQTRTITNQRKIAAFTRVKGMTDLWEIRYVPKEEFLIRADVFMYNQVYAVCQYQEGEVFCVEMHNKEVAAMQKELFECMWRQAKPLTVMNERGEARLD